MELTLYKNSITRKVTYYIFTVSFNSIYDNVIFNEQLHKLYTYNRYA